MADDDKQWHEFDSLVRNAEKKLSRPLYRFFFRDEITIQTANNGQVVRARKSIWAEPTVWMFLIANSFWAFFCEWFCKVPFNKDTTVVAFIKIIGLFWMMGLPSAAVFLREASATEEKIVPSDFFAFAIWAGPFAGFLGSILIWIPALSLGLLK
jgi:hypothetical protein